MGMLRRVMANAFRRSPAVRGAREAIAPPPQHATTSNSAWALEQPLRTACEAGRVKEAFHLLDAQLPAPASQEEALSLFMQLALPALKACRRHGDADAACAIEYTAYDRLIKKFEDPTHYDTCFSMMDADLHALGLQDQLPLAEGGGKGNSQLFFLHNLADDFAHLELLCDLVDAYLTCRPQDARSIGFAGACGAQPSLRVRQLQQKWGVGVWPISRKLPIRQIYLAAARILLERRYDRLVHVAAPVGLSYLSSVMGPRLSWLSMKFELGSFDHLNHRCSFVSGVRRTRVVNGRRWHEAPPLFTHRRSLLSSGKSLEVLDSARRHGTVFYTVNREEKIRNPLYLAAVTRILLAVPDAAFVWTGRTPLPDIQRWFADRGLAERQYFAGWVEPDDLVIGGDIFLDTPVLSGTVAARAATCGRPVLTLVNSHSWINFFWPAYELERGSAHVADLDAAVARLERAGLSVECETFDAYVEQAITLARRPELREPYGALLGAFAKRYFFNAERSALAHFQNLNGGSIDE